MFKRTIVFALIIVFISGICKIKKDGKYIRLYDAEEKNSLTFECYDGDYIKKGCPLLNHFKCGDTPVKVQDRIFWALNSVTCGKINFNLAPIRVECTRATEALIPEFYDGNLIDICTTGLVI